MPAAESSRTVIVMMRRRPRDHPPGVAELFVEARQRNDAPQLQRRIDLCADFAERSEIPEGIGPPNWSDTTAGCTSPGAAGWYIVGSNQSCRGA